MDNIAATMKTEGMNTLGILRFLNKSQSMIKAITLDIRAAQSNASLHSLATSTAKKIDDLQYHTQSYLDQIGASKPKIRDMYNQQFAPLNATIEKLSEERTKLIDDTKKLIENLHACTAQNAAKPDTIKQLRTIDENLKRVEDSVKKLARNYDSLAIELFRLKEDTFRTAAPSVTPQAIIQPGKASTDDKKLS